VCPADSDVKALADTDCARATFAEAAASILPVLNVPRYSNFGGTAAVDGRRGRKRFKGEPTSQKTEEQVRVKKFHRGMKEARYTLSEKKGRSTRSSNKKQPRKPDPRASQHIVKRPLSKATGETESTQKGITIRIKIGVEAKLGS